MLASEDVSSEESRFASRSIDKVNQPVYASLDVISRSVIAGWAFDPDAPTTPIKIRIDIDGTAITTLTADNARPDLIPSLGDANHGFSYALPTLSPGSHQLNVYLTDEPTLAVTLFKSIIV